ncbi:long-chain fatty acid--CoA ligase [Zhongshania sp.]|uniref:long-chain fatty acid--CoA ligase n=1 Tax=Zhongshania sp. TaxID=1971902 RepID=UPI003564FA54
MNDLEVKNKKNLSGMQDFPMNLASILEHAARFHGDQEIVSRLASGDVHRYTYSDALMRAKKLANALKSYGIEAGDRVATLAWNEYRHLETWYGIAGQGAICHTVNPRLFSDQIRFIINHAGDRLVFVDPAFVALLEGIKHDLPSVELFIVLCDKDQFPATTLNNAIDYESFIADQSSDFSWAELSEESPSSLCYTSGTTGDPKGVLYSHRSNLLMAYASCSADAFNLSSLSTVLMVVPMFHANSWGLVYSAPMTGAKLVLPGPHLDGANIYDLISSEHVSFSAAVPTVWSMLLEHMTNNDLQLPDLKEVVIGGSAVPKSMIIRFKRAYDVDVLQAWGMTELSPLGTLNRPKPATLKLDEDAQFKMAAKQGRALFGVQMCIKSDDGQELPFDGKTPGRLMVRGPWVVRSYYRSDVVILDDDGWFDTGDIATIDSDGFMQITDRAKDIIKSGGEWISSVDLENAAISHPHVRHAAVIGIPHPKWEERPLLLVKLKDGCSLDDQALKDFLKDEVAKWWIPEDIRFVDDIPLTATGKFDKKVLRNQFVINSDS